MKERILSLLAWVTEYSLYGTIFCLPFSKAAAEVFISVAIISWLIQKIIHFKLKFLPASVLNVSLICFMLFNVLSVFFSLDFGLSVHALFSKVLEYVLIYFVVLDAIRTQAGVMRMLGIMVITALFVTVDGVIQFLYGTDILRFYPLFKHAHIYAVRACFKNPNHLGAWLITMIPPFLCMSLLWRPVYGKLYRRLGMIVLTFFMLVCLLLTYARAAWVGLVCGFIFIIYWFFRAFPYGKKLIYYSIIIMALLILFALLPLHIQESVTSIITMDGHEARINLWRKALVIIRDHPITGSGINTYAIVTAKAKYQIINKVYENFFPHNSYLHMAAEIGIIGLICFLWAVIQFFMYCISRLRITRSPLLLGLVSGMIAFLVHSFFDTNLYVLQLAILFWFLLGFSIAVAKIEMRSHDESNRI